ncbi:MFS transporter [Deinococcus cellulosilyticus]|uniref:MFS transporter n=1 Tax=Deinococcus cellulosilyticus (strain DSM 18568 / NBRC 106333 / KACC 11606 / 5516J-15) TaxID=1223518 RepID=A0A511NAL7_DEIC1|nr:MFS transporter [Deinococcus cellulosilyticus]GEM49875.1 MFS transporter [Deinococcus cellulosilyticus NBRC 106333 = KACC 11606]
MTVLTRPTATTETRLASRFILGFLGTCVFMCVYSTQSILPELSRDFHASAVATGATIGATTLAMALMSPIMGLIADAVGRKRVLIATLILLAIPTLLAGFSGSLQELVFWRFLQGLIIPGITVVSMAYVSEEFPKDRISYMLAAYVSGSVLGGFLGRLVSGIITEHYSWQTAFYVLGGLNLLGALLCQWMLPQSRNFIPQRKLGDALQSIKGHLSNPKLVTANTVGFFTLFSLTGLFTYVNYHLSDAPYNLGPATLGFLFTVYLIGMVITPLSGKWIAKLGNSKALILAMCASSLGMLLTLTPSLYTILLGLVLASSGVFVAQAAATSYVAANATYARSLASGLYNLCYYGGGAFSTLLVGFMFTHFGWTGAVLTLMGSQVVAAGVANFGWRRSGSGLSSAAA